MLNRQPVLKSFPALLSIFVMALGSFVMMGWVIENQSIVQIHKDFAPMQFNTALLFFLSGLSLWSLTEGQSKLSALLGVIIALLSGLSLSQYILGVNLGLDEMFVSHFIDANTTSPGRMSPNTGICFFLLGVALTLLSTYPKKYIPINISLVMTCVVFAVSSVAFAGYFSDVTTAYGWGQLTHMAMHTCIGFILVSLGTFVFHLQQAFTNHIKIDIPALVFVFILAITLSLWQTLNGHERLQLERRLSFYLEHVESDLNDEFDRYSSAMSKLNNLLNSGRVNPDDLEAYVVSLNAVTAIIQSNLNSELSILYVKGKSVDDDLMQKITSKLANHANNSALSNVFTSAKITSDIGTNYFLVYEKSLNSSAKDIFQLINTQVFIGNLTERYKEMGLFIEIENELGEKIISLPKEADTTSLLSLARVLDSVEWKVKIYTSKDKISDGSLANLVFIFGLIFCGLIVTISKLLVNTRERSIAIAREAEARQAALKEIKEVKLVNEMAGKVSGLGVWTWDLVTDEVQWDSNMCSIYNLDADKCTEIDLYGTWLALIHEDDRSHAEHSLLASVRDCRDWSCEFRLNLDESSIKYIIASGTFVTDTLGKPIKMVGGNIDVTELREAQERLIALKDQADKNSLAKSQFLANMSHEIRTPMNGVLGITDLLKKTNLTPIQNEYLELIKNSAGSLLRILNDILDHSKIEAGMLELVEDNFSLDNKVGDILKGFAPTAHQKMIELEYNIDLYVPSCIYADEMRVGQIIFNLVGNAVKFTESGEVIVELCSAVDTAELNVEDPFTLSITIKDTGIGIDEDKLTTIFEPFGQADNTTTRRFGGTGLGLPIVRQLVNLMGGTLTVNSQPSIGSEFEIKIPVRKGDPNKLSDEEGHAHIINNFDFTGITCLVVDNNSVNRKWLKSMIMSWGCKAIIAGSSEQALVLYQNEIANQGKVDVLIVDKDMPGEDGFSFIDSLTKKYSKIPQTIMMLTSTDISAALLKIDEVGIENYILKPVKQSEVFNMLVKIMEIDRPDLQTNIDDELPAPNKLLNILVAEDNPINSRLVHDILTYRGHQTTLAFNGQQALDQYKSGDYDVILMDVQMPELDGLEATRLIRDLERHKNRKPVVIIGLTAHALSGDRQICIDAGMNNYLTKPIDSRGLLMTLESYFSQVHSAQPIRISDSPETPKTSMQTASSHDSRRNVAQYKWLDLIGLKRVTGGQQDTIDAMVEMTAKILPQEISDMAELINKKEHTTLAKLCHRLKGMLSNLTGSSFDSDFIALETFAKENQMLEFELQWRKTEKSLQSLINELSNYTGRN